MVVSSTDTRVDRRVVGGCVHVDNGRKNVARIALSSLRQRRKRAAGRGARARRQVRRSLSRHFEDVDVVSWRCGDAVDARLVDSRGVVAKWW